MKKYSIFPRYVVLSSLNELQVKTINFLTFVMFRRDILLNNNKERHFKVNSPILLSVQPVHWPSNPQEARESRTE